MRNQQACLTLTWAMRNLGALILGIFGATQAHGQCEQVVITGNDLQSPDAFGISVHAGDQFAVIGASNHNGQKGAAYSFSRMPDGSWRQTQKLAPGGLLKNDNFGTAVTGDADWIAVGSFGGVYMYRSTPNGWSMTQKLVPTPGSACFGVSLSMLGDQLFVGDTCASSGAGRVSVFLNQGGTWALSQELVSSDGVGGDRFGNAIDASGNFLLVGAENNDGNSIHSGAAYIFENVGTWSEIKKLIPPPGFGGGYGKSVAMTDTYLAVGDKFSNRIFIYRTIGWGLKAKLKVPGSSVGETMAADETLIITGDQNSNLGGASSGAVHTFRLSTLGVWEFASTLVGDPGHGVGNALSYSGRFLVAGALGFKNFEGAAWIYDTPLGGTISNYCVGAPNSVGPGADIGYFGTTSISDNTATLRVAHCPPKEFGIFFYGPDTAQTPLGDGFLCVSGGGVGLFRLNPPVKTDAAGNAKRQIDFSQPPAGSGAGQVLGGTTWNFQYWYRDPAAGGAGHNLTDALRVTFCH